MILEHHAKMRLAIELIARRARISIVHQETGLSRPMLREVYREYHGVPAPSGQLPGLGGAMMGTRRQQLQASLFAVLYLRCGGNQRIHPFPALRTRSIYAAIEAHDQCQSLLGAGRSLDMTRCWVASCDLQVGAARLISCLRCEVPYLIADQLRFDDGCPICALYRAQRAPTSVPREAETNGVATPNAASARALLLAEERGFQHWQGRLRPPPTRGRQPVHAGGPAAGA